MVSSHQPLETAPSLPGLLAFYDFMSIPNFNLYCELQAAVIRISSIFSFLANYKSGKS